MMWMTLVNPYQGSALMMGDTAGCQLSNLTKVVTEIKTYCILFMIQEVRHSQAQSDFITKDLNGEKNTFLLKSIKR